jgi:excisionase family DNA binding protein
MVDHLTAPASEPAETYRRAEQRLRLLLLGDGVDSPGRVRGEEHRQQVIAELRRMRHAFDALLEDRAEKVEAGLEEELQRLASARSRAQNLAFVTPAEAAVTLRISVRSIYRAVKDGEIRAVRLTDKKRGALRIPVSELDRLLKARRE